MANLHHVYLTAHGLWNSGPWVGEAAQIGVRMCFVPVVGAPDPGAIFTPEQGGEIAPDFGTQAGTNGTLAKTWTARLGPVGTLENCDADMQIGFAEDMRTFLDTIKSYQSSAFRWTTVKVSAVDPDGKTPIVSSIYTFTSPVVGGTATALPPQVAMALSTRANLVGRRGRGRVYIPALAQSIVAADGTIASANASNLRSAFKTLIDNLQNLPGTPGRIPIVSVMSADSDTAVRPVEVRTGNRLDTIQSRRRQVPETYTATSLT